VRAEGTPLVDADGATFVWLGRGIPPRVVGDWNGWDRRAALRLRRADGAWIGRVALPRDAYVEYGLLRTGRQLRDPHNPVRTPNGVGGLNHAFWMPDATRRAIQLRDGDAPAGRVVRGTITLDGRMPPPRRRRFDLYLPHGAAEARQLPLLVVLDGSDYLDRGRLDRTLDGLIAAGDMAPIAVAFLEDAGEARPSEYGASDLTLSALTERVVPAAVRRLGLPSPAVEGGVGRAAILGSSLGGVMALHAAVRRPDVFGVAIIQSCAVGWGREWTTEVLARTQPPTPARLWLDVGLLEPLAGPVEDLASRLVERGNQVTFRPFPAGHSQPGWAESLVDALPAMFPPATGAHQLGPSTPLGRASRASR
jgi:enterochelin esterase family protein